MLFWWITATTGKITVLATAGIVGLLGAAVTLLGFLSPHVRTFDDETS